MISKKSKILLIGASTGGIEALTFILKDLPVSCPPIIISQHILPNFCQSLAMQIGKSSGRPTQIITTPIDLLIGNIYIQQPESTLSFKQGANHVKAIPTQAFGSSIFRPCIDEMFLAYQKNQLMPSCTAFLLTGMGTDGAQGLLALKNSQHLTIIQDQASCVVYGMPRAAKQIGASTTEMSLTSIKDNIRYTS